MERAAYTYGPFTHHLNHGGLAAIQAEQQLISTPSRYGVDGVRARTIPLERLSVLREAAIEFHTKEPPSTPEHQTNHEVSRDIADGERLDILVTRVKHMDGSITLEKKR